MEHIQLQTAALGLNLSISCGNAEQVLNVKKAHLNSMMLAKHETLAGMDSQPPTLPPESHDWGKHAITDTSSRGDQCKVSVQPTPCDQGLSRNAFESLTG